MTAVTVLEQIPTREPDREVLTATVTDGYTYTSKKFAKVKAVQLTGNEDLGALSIPLSAAISSNVVTIHCTGLSGKKVCIELIGKIGN